MPSKIPTAGERNPRIVLVRLLCIFGMIYVHVPPPVIVPGSALFHFDFLQAFLIEGFGRTSACLLSVVSGYLVAETLKNNKNQITRFYSKKFRSIYIPMVVWGLLTFTLFSLVSLSKPTFLNDVCGIDKNKFFSCANVIFHLTDMVHGPTMHLGFLRDLFVCMLLAPLLIIAVRYIPIVVLAVLLVLYLIDFESIVILRPLVILGFSVGIYIGLNRLNCQWVDDLWLVWAALAITTTILTIAVNQGQLQTLQQFFAAHELDARESLLYPLSRLFGAMSIWSISAKLLTVRSFQISRALEPFLFVAYCAHPLILIVIHHTSLSVFSAESLAWAYPIWFFLAPAVAILIARIGTVACASLVPGLANKMTGGRKRWRSPVPAT